jgi:CRISPR type IV-associated protein Csf3
MQSFRVTVELSSPMQVSEHPIHLDGVLSALQVRRLEDAGHPDPWSRQHDLPLERYRAPDGDWCFKASIFKGIPDTEPFFVPLAYRMNLAQVAEDQASGLLALRSAKANTAGGPFKAGIQLKPMVWIQHLCAYAVGDVKTTWELLDELEFIGPGRSRASGRVSAVTVEPVADELLWAQRALPSGFDLPIPFTVVPRAGGLRAPYWKKHLVTNILFPVEF